MAGRIRPAIDHWPASASDLATDDADPPTVQRWLDALPELVVGGYVSGSGPVFHVNDKGRKAADVMA